MRLPYPFVPRLPEPAIPGERYRIERGLAGARLFLAVASLLAIYLDPTEPTQYEAVAYALMSLYVLHSAMVLFLLSRRHEVSERFCMSVQIVDLLCPAVISVFTEGPNSPFFVVLFFAIMAAAFRWGFRASFINVVIALGVQTAEVAVLKWAPGMWLVMDAQFEANRLIIRAAYLVITGLVIGYAAEQEKQLRAESQIISRLAERARSTEGSLNATLHDVLGEILRVFRAQSGMAISREISTGRVFCWWIERRSDGTTTMRLSEPEYDERDNLWFEDPADTWFATRPAANPTANVWQLTGIDRNGRQKRELPRFELPRALSMFESSKNIVGISFTMGDAFTGRLLLSDMEAIGGVITELRFAQKMFQQVGPSFYNLYLVRKLRSRAGAIERARAARELHDGAIQSLIAAEMQVDVLRRRASTGAGVPNTDLERIQQILRREVLGLRELMQEMRPMELGARDLLGTLGDMVDRFRRDTGISARFVTELEDISLSPRVSREVLRIVQEALFNIRRHSGAKNVLVRFRDDNGRWVLQVEDDGCGFRFAGRLTSTEMESSRQGPLVIRERVRNVGGELTIESVPGEGARLEIALPQPKAKAIYA